MLQLLSQSLELIGFEGLVEVLAVAVVVVAAVDRKESLVLVFEVLSVPTTAVVLNARAL